MAFKTICEECGAEGKIVQRDNISVFSNAVVGEENITISYGEEERYDVIELRCLKCGHKVEE